ncbi:heterokaryon incompatibility protein-domain-containing protein, partial [Lophiotrema nucula]
MRLLNVRTFRVKDFTDPDIPPYAILSHVWIQRRKTMKEPPEPTLQDMWTGKAKELVGFRKIYHAASQAIKENLGYIWVDTVCIDKTNSTELFEAINSMFRWYAEARTCYAYLADVHEIADLSRSAWFTRGWTLQEMLAPQNVAFYSAGWHFLGHRADLSLEKPILEATGILEEQKSVLQSFDLGSWSIAERMSWASRRRTTRKEDLAYCLLGIFGVNMPLLYGEGESAAFIRLQGEIMKVSDDHSLFAW